MAKKTQRQTGIEAQRRDKSCSSVLVIDELVRGGSALAAELREEGYTILEASSVDSACTFIKHVGNNLEPLDVVLLALKPSASAALQYETACDRIAATVQACGRSCPAFLFFSLTETSTALARIAMDAAAAWFARRDVAGLTSALERISTQPPLPKVVAFDHAGEIDDICVDVAGDLHSLPLARAGRYYFEAIASIASEKRPRPATYIVAEMLRQRRYRDALCRITKRALITNFYRMIKAQEKLPDSFPPEITLVRRKYPGNKETLYAIRCAYSIRGCQER